MNNKTSGQILSDINIFKTVWYWPNDGKTDKDMRQRWEERGDHCRFGQHNFEKREKAKSWSTQCLAAVTSGQIFEKKPMAYTVYSLK